MRELSDQKYCSWCGSTITHNSAHSSTCDSCGYRSYVNPRPCCTVIVSKGDSILLLKRAIEPKLGMYDLPGGFVDASDSSIEVATHRELEEEIGLTGEEVSELVYLGSTSEMYSWLNVSLPTVTSFFTCSLKTSTEALSLDLGENSQLRWVSKKDLESIELAWGGDKRMLAQYFER